MADAEIKKTNKKTNKKTKVEVKVAKKASKPAKVEAVISVPAVKSASKKSTLSIDMFGLNGAKIGTTTLPEEIFGVKVNAILLAQAIRVYRANLREGNANTKTRGEVEGSTRKVWQQKGTGRARHGGVRAPIFVGGGIAFGPRTRDFRLKLPQKMKKVALFSALTAKFQDGHIRVTDDLTAATGKTIEFSKMFKTMQVADKKSRGHKVLFVMPGMADLIVRGLRNIDGVQYEMANNLNALDVVTHRYIIFQKNALGTLKNTFLKEETQ